MDMQESPKSPVLTGEQSDDSTSVLNNESPVMDSPQDDEIPESQDVSEEEADTPQGFRTSKVREIPSLCGPVG